MKPYPKQRMYLDTKPEDLKQKAYFDISIDDKKAGRLVFDLRTDITPRTVGNFIELCTHEHRYGYKGSKFFRIIPGAICQGGDWYTNNGATSMSCFSRKFRDENFDLKHDEPGVLSMANHGPDTNGSQFFITFAPMPKLDGKCVVFGKLEEGFDVLKKIERCGSKDGTPTKRVVVTRCDEIVHRGYYGQMNHVFGKPDPVSKNKKKQSQAGPTTTAVNGQKVSKQHNGISTVSVEALPV